MKQIPSKTQNREMITVCLLFLASVILRYILASFPKVLETYGDELLYYDIARSLFQGKGISVRNVANGINFQKIMYSVLLTPFFAVGNGVLRIRLISLFNCALMSSCVFPVWLISKELCLRERDRMIAVFAVVVWPDMLLSMTFMAEILYWPVVSWFLYVWLVNERKKSLALAIVEGALFFIGYLTKEVFLTVVVGCVATTVTYPIINRILGGKQPRKEGGRKLFLRETAIIGAAILTFLICVALSKRLFFVDQSNGYSEAVDVQSIWTADKLLYLIYYFFYYLAAVLLSVFVVPFSYSLAGWRNLLDEENRKFFCLVTLITIVSAGTVALTIAVKENLGDIAPRIHLRYIGPVLFMYLICYLKVNGELETRAVEDTAKKRNIITAAVVCLAGLFYKGTSMGSSVDHFTMHWYTFAQNRLAAMGISGRFGNLFFVGSIAITVLLLIVLSLAFLMRSRGQHKTVLTGYLMLMLALCYINYQIGSRYTTDPYKSEPQIIEDVERINEYFEDIGEDESKLYITLGAGNSQRAQCFDTYFDDIDQLIVTNPSWLESLALGTDTNVSDMQFYEPLFHAQYDRPEGIDYVIMDNDVDLGMKSFVGLEEIPDLSGENYRVYRNIDAQSIAFGYDESSTIFFSGDDFNADLYVTSGISHKEDGFTWTDGNSMRVMYPTEDDAVLWDVNIDILGTFNGMKSYEAHDAFGAVVAQGALETAGTISFSAMSSGGMLEFDIALPDSETVSKVWPGSTDSRKLAFQIVRIRLNPHGE